MPMTTIRRRAARAPFAPIVAAMFAVAAAVLAAALPGDLLLRFAGSASLAVRAAVILGAFVVAFAVAWAIAKPIGAGLDRRSRTAAPWRDSGYDTPAARAAPARRPIFAPQELGAPLMSDEALTTVPPVADPDPELAAPVIDEPLATPVAPRGDASIAGLIARLEAGLARRAANDPGPDTPGASPLPLPLPSEWIVAPSEETGPRDDDDGHGALRQALGQLRRLAG